MQIEQSSNRVLNLTKFLQALFNHPNFIEKPSETFDQHLGCVLQAPIEQFSLLSKPFPPVQYQFY